jgi:predicted Rossmann fold flavoprotein
MPELKKILIIGGGWAGLASAYWASRQTSAVQVVLVEKEVSPLAWSDRKGLAGYPVGNSRSEYRLDRLSDSVSTPIEERLLEQWPVQLNMEWLAALGIDLKEGNGSWRISNLRQLRRKLVSALHEQDVEIQTEYSLESVSVQPDGTFRIWSKAGDAITGSRLLMATGGQRNHGLKLAGELGLTVRPPLAAFLRLRLASPKIGERMGPLSREVRLRCLKSGEESLGELGISARGMEGRAVSQLSGMLAEKWNQLRHRLALEVDWIPHQTGGQVLKELLSQSERGGRRTIGAEPLFGFPQRSWEAILNDARVDPKDVWARMKTKKLQALANRLKATRMNIGGAGLPAQERAWFGGVDAADLDPASLQCKTVPGLHFAGEILDMRGPPEGGFQNLIWASAHVAGCSIGLFR